MIETVKGLEDSFPVERAQMDGGVAENIAYVVELPSPGQAVGIDDQEENEKGEEREQKPWRRRRMLTVVRFSAGGCVCHFE